MKALGFLLLGIASLAAQSSPPNSVAVPTADGYVEIAKAAHAPAKDTKYQAIFDATRLAEKPTQLVPALNMAGSELNALAAVNAPLTNAKFVVVFHGPAVDGWLKNDTYRAKYGTDNPNLETIGRMRKAGVEFFVCGQYLAGEKIDARSLTPEVIVAADALLVLMEYQNKGYAVLSF